MSDSFASLLVVLLGVYLGLGLVVGVAFVLRGAGRVDPAAAAGTWGFRLIVLPGAAALWPFVVRRWRQGAPPPEPRDAHREQARGGGAR